MHYLMFPQPFTPPHILIALPTLKLALFEHAQHNQRRPYVALAFPCLRMLLALHDAVFRVVLAVHETQYAFVAEGLQAY